MPVAFVTAASQSFTGATSVNISVTPSGTNRCMYAWSCTNGDNAGENSATFNSVAMTELLDSAPAGAFQLLALYRLIAPDATTANVTISWSTSADGIAGVIVLEGVDQTTADGGATAASSAFAGSTTPSVTIASESGDWVQDFVSAIGAPSSGTAGASQTERLDAHNGDDFFLALSSNQDGEASTAMDWTMDASGRWRTGGVSVNPAAGGGGGVKVPAFMLLGVR